MLPESEKAPAKLLLVLASTTVRFPEPFTVRPPFPLINPLTTRELVAPSTPTFCPLPVRVKVLAEMLVPVSIFPFRVR